MRILVATDQWFPDCMGGVARVATETSRRWAAASHEVVVIAPRNDGHPLEETSESGGLTLLRALPRGRLPQTLTDPPAARRWASRLAHQEFDVLVSHECTTACGLLAARLGLPLVYVFHADAAEETRYRRTTLRPGAEWLSAAAIARPLQSLDGIALRRASAVVVLSDFSRRLLSARAPAVAQHAVRVPGGVDTSAFSPNGRDEARQRLGVDSSTRLVFTVRRLEPRMGLENLLEAVALLDDMEGLRVAIAGSGGLTLRDRADRLRLGDRVELLGRVSDDDLPLWHKAADLFVLPTVAYEGFGLVTTEALASGTPVVGTPVGATPELLEPLDSRLLARGTDAASLASAIRTGLRITNPALRARCRAYALDRFAWDTVISGWSRILEDTVLRRRAERELIDAGNLHPRATADPPGVAP